MRALFYIIIILAALLPIFFRRLVWLRVASVAALWGFGVSLVWTHYAALHRLVTIRGVEQFHLQPGEQLPAGFQAATRIVQELSQTQLPFAMLLFVAFSILALVPALSTAKPNSTASATNK